MSSNGLICSQSHRNCTTMPCKETKTSEMSGYHAGPSRGIGKPGFFSMSCDNPGNSMQVIRSNNHQPKGSWYLKFPHCHRWIPIVAVVWYVVMGEQLLGLLPTCQIQGEKMCRQQGKLIKFPAMDQNNPVIKVGYTVTPVHTSTSHAEFIETLQHVLNIHGKHHGYPSRSINVALCKTLSEKVRLIPKSYPKHFLRRNLDP